MQASALGPAARAVEAVGKGRVETRVCDVSNYTAMQALADEPPGGRVLLNHARWDDASLAGAELVIGAADDEDEARRIFTAAQRAGIPVNVIDRPAYCTFNFGAIVNRSPLVVGISTDGAAPIFAQAIRSRMKIFAVPLVSPSCQSARLP